MIKGLKHNYNCIFRTQAEVLGSCVGLAEAVPGGQAALTDRPGGRDRWANQSVLEGQAREQQSAAAGHRSLPRGRSKIEII